MSNLSDVLSAPVNLPKVIPDDWKWQSLVNVCRPKQWKTISQNELTSSGFPVFGANGFIGYFSEFNHAEETIAVTCRGATCGTVNLVPPKTYITGNAMCLDDVTENAFIKYLYYAATYRTLSDAISGSAQPQITGDSLKFINIPFPPLPEQKKIASILTSVDEVIEKTQSQIDKLQDLKKGTMNELLTKGIGHTEFKDSELGRIPKSWEVVELKDTLSFISYGFTNPMPESEFGNFMVTAKDVLGGKISYETSRKTTNEAYTKLLTDKSRPETGDILLTKDGTLGRLAIVDRDDLCINQSVAVLRPNQMATSLFLFFLLSSPAYQKTMIENAGGSTIKHIYITVVDKMKVAIPKKEEQTEIVSVLLSLEKQIEIVEKKLHQTQSLKKSLMQDLLTGRVRVSVN
jgi:type I restriction enzyme, S subunit